MTITKLFLSPCTPMHYVIEREGVFYKFVKSPYRKIEETDLSEIPFYTPIGNNGEEAPDCIYNFYGFNKEEKNET